MMFVAPRERERESFTILCVRIIKGKHTYIISQRERERVVASKNDILTIDRNRKKCIETEYYL